MHIEELGEDGTVGAGAGGGSGLVLLAAAPQIGMLTAKRAAVGVGARVLFYPTLMYNVIRNKMQSEFHWWDEVDEFLLLGAVPFPSDVPRLKQLGVHGVITLNEPYETLVPSSLYHAHGIEHLVIPTRDYLFAPSCGDICRAVDFIHKNASSGKTTYVHCKAGRGRSTTVVLCYLVQHKQMTPNEAYEYVKLSRPRVRLASSQRQAVEEYYSLRMMKVGRLNFWVTPNALVASRNFVAFDDSSYVVVSESDLNGYDGDHGTTGYVGSCLWAELSLAYRVQYAGQAALARLSLFVLGCHAKQEAVLPDNKLVREGFSFEADRLGHRHPSLLREVEVTS